MRGCRQRRAKWRVQVQHVPQRLHARLARRFHLRACALERRADRVDHQRVLAAVLRAREQPGRGRDTPARDQRIVRDPRRTREGIAGHHIARASHELLGGGCDQRSRARRPHQHARRVAVPLVERSQQRRRPHAPGQGHPVLPRRHDLRHRAVCDRVGDRRDARPPLRGGVRLVLHQIRLARRHHGVREDRAKPCELRLPAGGVRRVPPVDGEHQPAHAPIVHVGPARQREPRIAEAGPRGMVRGSGRERRAADPPRARRAQRIDRDDVAIADGVVDRQRARLAHDLAPSRIAVAPQLARHADAHDRDGAPGSGRPICRCRRLRRGGPRETHLVAERLDQGRRVDHGRRHRDHRQPVSRVAVRGSAQSRAQRGQARVDGGAPRRARRRAHAHARHRRADATRARLSRQAHGCSAGVAT